MTGKEREEYLSDTTRRESASQVEIEREQARDERRLRPTVAFLEDLEHLEGGIEDIGEGEGEQRAKRNSQDEARSTLRRSR